MEITLEDNRRCQTVNILIRCKYCATLSTIFASIANLIRYEVIYWKNNGRIFETKEEYILWKNTNLPNIKYIFVVLESMCKIALLFYSQMMKEENLYYISIFIMQSQYWSFLDCFLYMLYSQLCVIHIFS